MELERIHNWLKLAQLPYQLSNQILSQLDPDVDESEQLNHQLSVFSKKTDPELITHVINWLKEKAHQILIRPDFPSQLKSIKDPPVLLFLAGDKELLYSRQIAIVGTRNPTISGRENGRYFSHFLAENNLTITSGMAIGIDGTAHKSALQAKGKTLAVLGSGHQHCYPPEHQKLYEDIVTNGLVISEFLPYTGVKPYHFPRRNRLISGLSLGVLIVEGTIKSGSLITCNLALEQGRDVFAIPSDITNKMARGCHKIIQQGAMLVDSPEQILDELNLNSQFNNNVSKPQLRHNFNLNKEEQTVLNSIHRHPTTVDQIYARNHLELSDLLAILFELELKNLIGCTAKGYYRL